MSKKITRSTVNEQQYSAPEFPTSGFPLSYRRYMSGMLGRIHVNGFQYTMPGDKISGKSSGKFTFKRVVTPIVSPVNAMQYNIYLPFRPLDRSFKKGITPTKLNGMSASWTMPMCSTRYLVQQILAYYSDTMVYPQGISSFDQLLGDLVRTAKNSPSDTLDDWLSNLNWGTSAAIYANDHLVGALTTSLYTNETGFTPMADALYCRDALIDIMESITAKLGDSNNPISGSMNIREFCNLYLSTILTPWVGRYSYYGEFKYEYLRPYDFYRISHGLAQDIPSGGLFSSILSDTPQNEYPLRAMYAIWYELFRNVDLEPVSTTLPDWQEWSTTSIFDMSAGGNLCYLLLRIRPWEKDMFISAQVDDLSRHVYAPVINANDSDVAYHAETRNNRDANIDGDSNHPAFGDGRPPSIYRLGWLDSLSGVEKTIDCPVPSNINDVLSALDNTFVDVYGLDLNTLRQSQALEKYLKRNYLFGDEYQDRMLAHYNSRVSDMRINKPEILSQSMDGYNMSQQVSNVSTGESKVGDRTATATVDVNGNEYSTFCEEFGIVISLVCFMPRAMYDGTTPQLYMSKQVHLPLPEFATNNEEFGRKSEIAGSGLVSGYSGDDQDTKFMFGRYPAYHAWRSRVDEVGGEFLDELQDSTFRRFFGMFSADTTPKLNYFFIHCRPNLNMFADNIMYDTQLYGDIVNDCYVERVLPTPVEVI